MAVREATEADLPALVPLLRGYVEFYETNPSDEQLEAMARDVIAAPEDRAFMLVATDDDDEVVGFALNQWKWSSLNGARVVVMDDLFVAESARGAGHADALIEAVADVARQPRRADASAGSRCPTTSGRTRSTTASAAPPRRCWSTSYVSHNSDGCSASPPLPSGRALLREGRS